ncbi:MAG: hypothetical protein AAGN35_04420 [Bacteroidota bacterium]
MKPMIFCWPGGTVPTQSGELQLSPWVIASHLEQAKTLIVESFKEEARPFVARYLRTNAPRVAPVGRKG